jgi:hypothetical protein
LGTAKVADKLTAVSAKKKNGLRDLLIGVSINTAYVCEIMFGRRELDHMAAFCRMYFQKVIVAHDV